MRRRHLPLLVVLGIATACQDVPLTPLAPPAPDEPRLTIAGGSTDLRSGYGYVCALRSGVIACFGENDEGQPVGVHRAATGTFVQLTAAATHACGLRSDGAVECFGANDFGKAPPLRRATTGSYTAVSGGGSHSCALRTDGILECWGSNEYGQAPPVKQAQAGRYTQVSASATSTCGLRSDGVVECWGRREAAPSIRRAASGSYVQLAPSVGATNCALASDGVADCWGYLAGRHAGPYVQVVVGGGHVCALRSNGVAECFGYPGSWEGPGDRTLERGIVRPAGEQLWSRISAGSYHACGLRADGHFECFGTQMMGSDAPDVIPVGNPTKASLYNWRIRLDWRDRNSNDRRTEIERAVLDGAGNEGPFTRIAAVTYSHVLYIDSVAAAGATYEYRTRVCNNAGCSEWEYSNPARFPSSVPPAPRVTATGYVCGYESCARVTWTVDNTFVEAFRLQRRVVTSTGYGAWQILPEQSRTATRYDDYALTPGATYQYRMGSCNARGCSGYAESNTVVVPKVPPPAAPADLSAAAMGNYVYLAWGDVANETTYELQRRQYTGGAWGAWSDPIVRAMNVTNHQDPAPPGVLYQYRIRACNQGGCSAYTYSAETQT